MDNEVSLKLYSPLTADWIPDDGEYGWDEPALADDPEQLTGSDLVKYQDKIEAALSADEYYDAGGIDLYQFGAEVEFFGMDSATPYRYDGKAVFEKVKTVHVDVCNRGGELMACTTVSLNQNLTKEEMNELKEFLTCQFANGWGERFELQDIPAADSFINVYFWQETGFFLQPEYVLPDREKPSVHPQAQTGPQKPVLPHINLAGPDGNIYAVMGKAGQVLRQAGQGEKVSEMNKRVFACSSYDEALGIISEYVQTDFSPSQPKEKQPPDRSDAR